MTYKRDTNHWPYKNLTRARMKAMTKAAEQGSGDALYDMGLLYETGQRVAPRSNELALKYYRQASDAGSADASNYLGRVYRYGWFIDSPDLPKALDYYEKAIDQGLASAENDRDVVAGLLID